jgi:precorrin-2/cobalt-factor-2 C20-methyltransferase
MSEPTFYGVGVGPGDPELLTLKAQRVLQAVPVVAVPKGCGKRSYAYSVVQAFLDETRQEVLELTFSMSTEEEVQRPYWQAAIEEIEKRLAQRKDVAFLTEGDPFFYSTFIPLYRLMQQQHPGVRIEVVPGVTSVAAVAAVSGLPLARAEEKIAILPATSVRSALPEIFKTFNTVVLMKVSSVLDEVIDELTAMGLKEQACLVEKCTTAEERVIHDLDSVRGQQLHYFSTLLVCKASPACTCGAGTGAPSQRGDKRSRV